jgi:hypothetical protein
MQLLISVACATKRFSHLLIAHFSHLVVQELVSDAAEGVRALLAYPLEATLGSPEAKSVVEDGFKEVAGAVLAAYESGELATALAGGHDGFKVCTAV